MFSLSKRLKSSWALDLKFSDRTLATSKMPCADVTRCPSGMKLPQYEAEHEKSKSCWDRNWLRRSWFELSNPIYSSLWAESLGCISLICYRHENAAKICKATLASRPWPVFQAFHAFHEFHVFNIPSMSLSVRVWYESIIEVEELVRVRSKSKITFSQGQLQTQVAGWKQQCAHFVTSHSILALSWSQVLSFMICSVVWCVLHSQLTDVF